MSSPGRSSARTRSTSATWRCPSQMGTATKLTDDQVLVIMTGVLVCNPDADEDEMARVVDWVDTALREADFARRVLSGEMVADWPEGADEPRLALSDGTRLS